MKTKSPKWHRIEELTTEEQKRLDQVCSNTPGMTVYGHRARMAVMLPVELAEKVSKLSEMNGKSTSFTCEILINFALSKVKVSQ